MATKENIVALKLRMKEAAQFRRDARAVSTSLRDATRHLASFQHRLRFLSGAVGFGGLAAAGLLIRKFVRDLTTIPEAVNQAQRGLSVILQASFGIEKYKAAQKVSAELYRQLLAISDVSPGNINDYLEGFRDISSMAKGTGASLKELMALTRNVVTLNEVYGFQKGVASRDIRQILGGMGNIALIQVPQLKAISLEAARLAREGDKMAALGLITRALELDKAAVEDFGRSWTAQLDTMTNNWIRFASMAGRPVLQWLSDELRSANRWLKDNRDKVREFAEALGRRVVRALKWIKEAVRWLYDNWDKIVQLVKILASWWVARVLYDGIAGVLGLVRTLVTAFTNLNIAAQGIGSSIMGWVVNLAAALVSASLVIAQLQKIQTGQIDAGAGDKVRTGIGAFVSAKSAADRKAAYRQIFEGHFAQRYLQMAGPAWRDRLGDKAFAGRVAMAAQVDTMRDMVHGIKGYRIGLATRPDGSIDLSRIRASGAETYGWISAYLQGVSGGKGQNKGAAGEGVKKLLEAALKARLELNLNADMRGSRIEVQQNFRDEDPDAVFFAFQQGIGRGIVRTTSERAPRLD